MEEQTLAQSIANQIAVGWRKGVDGVGSGRMYQALNPLFFNDDEAIQKIGNEHVQALGEAGALVLERKGTPKELAEALKAAACIERPCGEATFTITHDNQGLAILKSLLPIEWEEYGRTYRVIVDDGDLRTEMKPHGKTDWEPWRYLSTEISSFTCITILALMKRYESINTIFAEFLVSQEPEKRKELFEAAVQVTDDGWLSMAHWIMYSLDIDTDTGDN